MKVKLAILASRFPYPLDQGDRLRLYHQIRHLSKKFDIYLICTTHEKVDADNQTELKRFCKEIYVIPIGFLHIITSVLYFYFSGKPLELAMFFSRKAKIKVNEILRNLKPDLIYCHLFRMAEYCTALDCPTVIDLMDAFSASMWRRSKISRFPFNLIYLLESARIKKYEEKILKNFDVATIISEQDKALLSKDLHHKVYVVSNGVDTDYFNRAKVVGDRRVVHDLIFVGNMGYLPNIEAAEYLVNKLLSRINKNLESDKALSIYIVGNRPDGRVRRLRSPCVFVSGWVDDIREAYVCGKVFCAPIFSGTGQQNKILEAMAMGVPCVTTSEVNNAIGAKDGEEILIAHDEQSFEECVLSLLNDCELMETLSKNGRKFVEKQYSWQEKTQVLEQIFIRQLLE